MIKICCTCKLEKLVNIDNFCKNKLSKDGFSSQCKICAKIYRDSHKEQKNNYPSSTKEYRDNYLKQNLQHINELRRIRYIKNIDKLKEANRKNYFKFKTKRRAQQRIYYINNIKYFTEKNKKFKENNRLYVYLKNRVRTKKIKSNPITQQQIINLLSIYNNKCYYCGIIVEVSKNLHLDHKIPLSRNGDHNIDNLVPSCITCNLRKGIKTDMEFIEFLKEENKCL